MNKYIKVLLVSMGAFLASVVQAVELKEDHPDVYVVQKGDTLWGIAEKFLDEPWFWPELWQNNEGIANPHLIYPGDILKLTYVDGNPRLSVDRGGVSSEGAVLTEDQSSDASSGSAPRTIKFRKGDTVKLTPEVISQPLDTVIPAIPLEKIQSFLRNHRVMMEDELEDAPYVLAGEEKHIIVGVGDNFYARGNWDDAKGTYGVYRKHVDFYDPNTKEFLGRSALEVGQAEFDYSEGDIANLELTMMREDVRINDKLLPTTEQRVDSVFYPKVPDQPVAGEIIHVFSGVRNVSQNDVVVVNLGEDKVEVGDVLTVSVEGETIKDRKTGETLKLPDERRGILMVFRTFEKVAFGLIIRSTAPLTIGDTVSNPK